MNIIFQWFYALESQEKNALIFGVLALFIISLYYFVWAPFHEEKQALRTIVASQKSTLAWMQSATNEIQQLRQRSSTTQNTTTSTSLLSLVEQSSTLLGKVEKRIEPQGEQAVKITLDKVSFTQLITWLGQLYNQHGIEVRQIHIERETAADMVNVRLTLASL